MESDQDEPTAAELAAEFNRHGKAAADHYIKRGQNVAIAHAKGGGYYEEFCTEAGLDPESSTTRKYRRIGSGADWLLPISDQIPPDWTTIYDLAKLGRDKVLGMISSGRLNSHSTARQIKANGLAADENTLSTLKADVPQSVVLRVDASSLSRDDQLRLYGDLEKKAAPYGLKVEGLPTEMKAKFIIEREAA